MARSLGLPNSADGHVETLVSAVAEGARAAGGRASTDWFHLVVFADGQLLGPSRRLADERCVAWNRIHFSNDYPYEDHAESGDFIDTVPIGASDRRKIAYDNAKALYKL